MSEPKSIGDIMLALAANPTDEYGKLLRKCPFIQKELMRLHISQRTLQTLRSNGTIPFIKIGHKIWYHKADLERILKDNYTMFKIEERYGKDN